MKRRLGFVLAALLLALGLSGCQMLCRHDWESATCNRPATCGKCQKTEGEALEHRWEQADCETPETCRRCGDTRGDPKGHRWTEATCLEPEICTVCGKTGGDPAGHAWQAATCQAPKTCLVCAATEGTPLYHAWQAATTEAPRTCVNCGMTTGFAIDADARFTTADTVALQGVWMTDFAVSGEMVGEPGFTDVLEGTVYVTFGNAGIMTVRLETRNMPEFEEAMLSYIQERIYDEFAAKGLGRDAAQLAIRATMGMTVEEYAAQILEDVDVPGIIGELTKERVYYAKGSTVYIADDWNSSFLSSTYRFEKGTLIFDEVYLSDPGTPLQWSPVTE